MFGTPSQTADNVQSPIACRASKGENREKMKKIFPGRIYAIQGSLRFLRMLLIRLLLPTANNLSFFKLLSA